MSNIRSMVQGGKELGRELRQGQFIFDFEISLKRLKNDIQDHMDYDLKEIKDIISSTEEFLINIKEIERRNYGK